MPELPEVQTLVNDLNAAGLIGKTITAAKVYWPRSIAQPSARAFCNPDATTIAVLLLVAS